MSTSADKAALGRARGRGRHRLRSLGHHLAMVLAHYSRYARLMRLDRPIGTWLLLWPTLWALWIAGAGQPHEKVFIVMVLGSIIVRSAGCVINDLADRKIDPLVRRTSDRPLATGEVTPAEALVVFVALMLIGLGLVLSLNRLALMLAVVGALLAILYPYTKRFLSAPQFVLGLAFAWGVPMAFAAQLGEVPRVGWLLFMTVIAWVVIYDTQYAMVDREDDMKIGVKSSAIMFGDQDRAVIAGLQLVLLVGLALVGHNAELGVWYYGGLGIGAVLALYQQYLIRKRDPDACFDAFLNNAWFGGVVFAGIVLDYLFRQT